MTPVEKENLQIILAELVDAIHDYCPGLPKGWMSRMINKIIDISECKK